MSDQAIRFMPQVMSGLPKEAMTDLYRAKYGLPLDGESHERFIATKVPYRKNKDYRPRFRNYSFGYPTYKKDNYTRHWYNFVDIWNSHATQVRLFKLYVSSYVIGLVYNAVGGMNAIIKPETNALEKHKLGTSTDYVKQISLRAGFNELFALNHRPATSFALFTTSYMFIVQKLRDWDYSLAQSYLRASLIVSPVLVFLSKDRPFHNFWWRSALLAGFLCIFFY